MIARTADRALQIFELFAECLRPLTLSELARDLDIPVSTCAKLIRTLLARGYLYEVGNRKSYYPTARWLQKATAISSADLIVEHARPFLQELRDSTRETALLAKRMGDQVIYLGIAESPHEIRYSGQVGDMKELWRTASGFAFLGTMTLVRRLETMTRLANRSNGPTAAERKDVLSYVDDGMQRRWWLVRGANVSDVLSVASPLGLEDDYAVVVVGPISRMEPQLQFMSGQLMQVCRKLAGVLH